jgi:hypothetical protein
MLAQNCFCGIVTESGPFQNIVLGSEIALFIENISGAEGQIGGRQFQGLLAGFSVMIGLCQAQGGIVPGECLGAFGVKSFVSVLFSSLDHGFPEKRRSSSYAVIDAEKDGGYADIAGKIIDAKDTPVVAEDVNPLVKIRLGDWLAVVIEDISHGAVRLFDRGQA